MSRQPRTRQDRPRISTGLVLVVLALLLALSPLEDACESPNRTGLPLHVNVVAHLESGENLSLLVDLHAPRRRPTVRVAQGLLYFDGDHMWEVGRVPRVDDSSHIVMDLDLVDLLGESEGRVQIAPPAASDGHVELMSIAGHTAVVRGYGEGWERWIDVDLGSGVGEEIANSAASARFVHYGPGRGFVVFLEEDTLMLKLPRTDDEASVPLIGGVERIVGVNWLPERSFSKRVEGLLDRRFKMAGSLAAHAQTCRVDGDLEEWTQDAALGVSEPAQVHQGQAFWSGPRDASLALAARLTPEALCTAVRIRDADILVGVDELEFVISGHSERIRIAEGPQVREEAGGELRMAFTDRVPFGTGIEICFGPSYWEPTPSGLVYFRLVYRDADPDEGVSVLASAPEVPWPYLAGIRLPRRGRDGLPGEVTPRR